MSALFEVVYLSSMVSTSLPLPINKTKKGQVMEKNEVKGQVDCNFLASQFSDIRGNIIPNSQQEKCTFSPNLSLKFPKCVIA